MIVIIQGEKQPFELNLSSLKNGTAFDLTGFTDITVCFKIGSTTIEKKESDGDVTVVSEPRGEISTFLTVADTDSLTPGTDGAIEVLVDFGGGDIKKAQDLNAFKVVAKICS